MAMIELDRRGQVFVATMNRPPVNAIDDAMISAFHRVLDGLETERDWTVLHIRSAHKVFAAGADLELIRSWTKAAEPRRAFSAYIDRLQGLLQRLGRLPQVTCCEIGGAAMGGGFELTLWCDLRMAADEAKIGLPEVAIGLFPAAGGTQRLTQLCGHGVASRVILSGEPVDGRTAAALGMVQWSFPRNELEKQAGAIIDRIARMPAAALQAAKQCLAAAADERAHGYRLERDMAAALLDNHETQALIAAFLDKSNAPAKPT